MEYYGLCWDREGEVRRVPRHVVLNVIAAHRDLCRFQYRTWEQNADKLGVEWRQCPPSNLLDGHDPVALMKLAMED
jgi:hypothetical protein